MAGRRKPPQARDRALGAQLKSIREQQTDFSLEAAAELLQWSSATMSRTENGKRHITAEEVASILTVYRVPIDQRDSLVRQAKAIDEPGWWSRPLPGVPEELGALASYEAGANVITDWSINMIPGLLQIYEYTMAYAFEDGATKEDSEMIWMARLRRQQVVPRVDYTAYIGEAALRTPFGGRAFVNQLKHLVDATHRGIGIRVVSEHRPIASLLHSWMLLEFPASPPIAHVELLRGGVFMHEPEVTRFAEDRDALRKIALSTAESRDMLRKLIEQREGRR
ncbi:MAG TPA: helix-turn-helix transcriptional regulator [Actinophytocola sp.]|nr:helix-turn-helix transcriptional regulator [Actinophytocola sp.]